MNIHKLPLLLSLAAFLLAANVAGSHAQMVDPAIDRPDEPFSYFGKPTDVLSVMDAHEGTLITPEGYLYTGFGELMFFTGNPPKPINQRVKTLRDGYLPVLDYRFERDGFMYAFAMVAATLDGKPSGPLVNFIRVRIRNSSNKPATRFFSAGLRYQDDVDTDSGKGDHRFLRPVIAKQLGDYSQIGVKFDPNWIYGFRGDAFVRDGKAMYLFPTDAAASRMLTLETRGNEVPNPKERALRILPTTPVGIVQYRIVLAPGQERVLEFRMPYEPIPYDDGAAIAALRAPAFDDVLRDTEKGWDAIVDRGIDISVPESKVDDTFKASLIYDLIARDKVGGDYVQNVNKFQYHAFWLRDASYIARMYDVSGYADYARQVLDFFARWQRPEGNFVSQGGQFDGWGQTLWAYGQHYRITRDRNFAARVYPSVERAVKWLQAARRADPLGLLPATTPGDNEDISGHITGHSFWALAGLLNAAVLAEAVGNASDAQNYRAIYKDYKAALLRKLDQVTSRTGGYIPPGLDRTGGQDWGNLQSVYPEMILDPLDPMVTATLEATRKKYREGLMTYGNERWLHHYLTPMNTETELVRGEQEKVIQDFYALLLHTSSTHAGFEFCVLPWGTRDFGQNLAPHGTFAASFRLLMRDMMVREQGYDLHIMSAISPAWTREGDEIVVRRAPTNFGEVNYTARFSGTGEKIDFANHWTAVPATIVVHVPWFVKIDSAEADGTKVDVQNGKVRLSAQVHHVVLEWTRVAQTRPVSFDQSVRDYEAEYRRHYEIFLSTGRSEDQHHE